MPGDKDDVQDEKIAKNALAINTLQGDMRTFRSVSAERHTSVTATLDTNTGAVDAMRKAIEAKALKDEERHVAADAKEVADKKEAKDAERDAKEETRKFWRGLVGDWRAWLAVVVVVFAISSPRSVPMLIRVAAHYANIDVDVIEAPADPATVPANHPHIDPEVPNPEPNPE